MRQKAFTLVEVIVVITMITLISGVFLVDFRGARHRQQVLIAAEQTVAMMQQSHAEVQAGATSDGSWVCRGGYFELGQNPVMAEAPLSGSACDWDSLSTTTYGMQADAQVNSATAAYVMFLPPDGDLILYDGAATSVQDADIVLGSEQVDSEFTIHVSSLTGQTAILKPSDE